MYMLSYVSYSLSVPSPLEIPGKALDVPAKAVASMPGISGFLDKIIQSHIIAKIKVIAQYVGIVALVLLTGYILYRVCKVLFKKK